MTIVVDTVSYAYTDRHRVATPVLRDLSLNIAEGVCLGILGPEGSGKSTLLQLLDALLRPDRGRVLVDGVDLQAEPGRIREFRRRVGMAFQFPEQQFLCGTVGEELTYTADRFDVRDRLDPARALERFGLEYAAVSARSPLLLSLGEARRVALATLLVHRPSVYLLDEPTSGLDGPGTECVIKTVRFLQNEGRTVVIASHDVDVLAETATRMAVLAEGRIVHEGDVRSVLGNATLLGNYGFAVPEAVQLLRTRVDPGDNPLPVRIEEIREYLTCRSGARGGG